MLSTSDIKKGLCINYSNDIYKIIEFLHVKPGKGPAFVRTKLKSVTSGKVIDNTFPAGHKIDDVKEGFIVTIIINTENSDILSVEMPLSVVLEVVSSEPGVKGNTATNATKPAVLETGVEINVPLFINEGDKVKVDTEKGDYIERIKD
jgi:elongation factor P